jgi:hypothetical protein
MLSLIGEYYPHLVVIGMGAFGLVLLGVTVADHFHKPN